ncbi:MAG: HAD family hydrolase [Patescibacteria group bacterium]
MIKAIIFDIDEMIVAREMYFSERLAIDYGVSLDKILSFFNNEFQRCLVGRADLKQEIVKYLPQWGWDKSVDDLLAYWFSHENKKDERILASVKNLQSKGIKCYLATNNEKYRAAYLFNDLGLAKLFNGAWAAPDFGYRKPQLEFWQALHDRIGQPTKNEVLVWDSHQDNVKSAREFGFQAERYLDFGSYENKIKTLMS